MFTTYKTTGGETFQSISRRVYGSANYTARLRSANPGVAEPMIEGLSIQTPRDATARDLRGLDGLAVSFDGELLQGYTAVKITRSFDSVDTLEISTPFDPFDSAQLEAFAPFRYAPMTVTLDGEALFTGTTVDTTPATSPDGYTIGLGAYAKAGVLGDCALAPIQYKKKSLSYILNDICGRFGIAVTFEAPVGADFPKVAYEGGSLWDFVVSLTKQRGLLAASDANGGLRVFKAPATGPVVAELVDGQPPVTAVNGSFAARGVYSEITGAVPVELGAVGKKSTVKTGIDANRPFFISYDDIKPSELSAAITATIGRMYASRTSYSASVATWFNRDGDVWDAGQFVTLRSPGLFLPDAKLFMIRTVELELSGDARTASLNLIEAGAYDGGDS